MYILKNKGTAKISTQFQLRNEDFEIVALFKQKSARKIFNQYQIDTGNEELEIFLGNLQFGKLTKLKLK